MSTAPIAPVTRERPPHGERLTPSQRLARFVAPVARALRAIAGVPDYDRYVAHMRRRHPGVAILSRAELFTTRQRERFERPGGRCC
jgi:uncharacterized short protein YbdD (DUF466 family)